MCPLDVLSLLPFKDLVLLALGGYLSHIGAQYFYWLSLRHSIFNLVSLMNAFLKAESCEVRGDPYPVYRVLENKALELIYHGHTKAYSICHKVAEDMERYFRALRKTEGSGNTFDFRKSKTGWLSALSELEPNREAFFWFRKCEAEVFRIYSEKEAEYCHYPLLQTGKRIKDLSELEFK